jgi:hypothetical protein
MLSKPINQCFEDGIAVISFSVFPFYRRPLNGYLIEVLCRRTYRRTRRGRSFVHYV